MFQYHSIQEGEYSNLHQKKKKKNNSSHMQANNYCKATDPDDAFQLYLSSYSHCK
jgi:hypothetical protein